MRITQNIAAMSASRAATTNQTGVDRAMERLSSGLRINRAADDAAGLAIAQGMRAQANGLEQAVRNVNDGISLLQTAEGSLDEDHAILQRMRTLAVQAANGTNDPGTLRHIQAEMTQLMVDIDRIAGATQFNGMPLLDGTFRQKSFQVGANAGEATTVTIGDVVSPAVPGTPPRFALWNLDDPVVRSAVPNPFVVTQKLTTTGEARTVSVPLSSAPTSATELADLLRADPAFDAAFEVSTGSIRMADGTSRPNVNIVITARQPGAGKVSVPVPEGLKTKTAPGTDPIPEEYGGYRAVDLLGGPIDVVRQAGASTVIVKDPGSPSGSGYEGLGDADQRPTPPRPAGPDRTVTTTWSSGALEAIERIDRAIARVSLGRAEMGATQNALAHTARSAGVAAENLVHAESRIRDADIAREVTQMQRWQTLCQSSVSMLAEAHTVPQTLLKLLG